MEKDETTEEHANKGDQKQPTKAEQKEKRRFEKEEQKKQERKKQKIKKTAKWSVAIAAILLIGGLVSPYLGKENNSQEKNQGEKNEKLAIKDTDWVEGNKDAKVVLIEYSDFQCPACAGFSQAVMQLRQKYGDRVAFVFRHFPLTQLHPQTKTISAAAEAAGKQGKFWEMHDMLFARRNEIDNTDNLNELLKQYAWKLDLDMNKFEEELQSEEVMEKINAQYREAVNLGLNATPTFFINGEQVKSLRSYKQLEDAIEDALNESL